MAHTRSAILTFANVASSYVITNLKIGQVFASITAHCYESNIVCIAVFGIFTDW